MAHVRANLHRHYILIHIMKEDPRVLLPRRECSLHQPHALLAKILWPACHRFPGGGRKARLRPVRRQPVLRRHAPRAHAAVEDGNPIGRIRLESLARAVGRSAVDDHQLRPAKLQVMLHQLVHVGHLVARLQA